MSSCVVGEAIVHGLPFSAAGLSWLMLRAINVILLLNCAQLGTFYSSVSASAAATTVEDAGNVKASPRPQSVSSIRSNAETAFSKGEIDKALELFSQVIDREPKNERNYYKRFRVYLSKRKYREAISDLSKALEIKPKYKQALAQRAKLYNMVGDCRQSVRDYRALQEMDRESKEAATGLPGAEACLAAMAEAEGAYQRRDWARAKELYGMALEHIELGAAQLLERAKCSFQMNDWVEVIADAGRAVKLESDNTEALELRGWAYYQTGDTDMASTHFREVLKWDPEHKNCQEGYKRSRSITKKILSGDQSFDQGKFADAAASWREATTVDPGHGALVGGLLIKVASAEARQRRWAEVKRAAQEALNVDAHLREAHIYMGDALLEEESFEEAIHAYRRAREMDQGDQHVAEKLQRAEAALKQSKQKNYYKILGVPRNADKGTIKKAYRELALKWHPDKWSTEAEKETAETQFQAVAEAHEVLTDEELRAKYDRGEEVFANQGGQQQQQHHPFHHFQQGGQTFHFRFG